MKHIQLFEFFLNENVSKKYIVIKDIPGNVLWKLVFDEDGVWGSDTLPANDIIFKKGEILNNIGSETINTDFGSLTSNFIGHGYPKNMINTIKTNNKYHEKILGINDEHFREYIKKDE